MVRNQSGPDSHTTLQGLITDFSGGVLTLRLPNRGTVRTISAADVVDVQTPLVEQHIRGRQAFRQGDSSSAIQHLQTALRDETRSWVQQDILALLVRSHERAGDHVAAMRHFAQLVQLDAQTRHFHLIPLCWADRATSSKEQSAARDLLTRPESVLRLMGASVLIADERNRPFGEAELDALTGDRDLRIKQLAYTQLWRLRLRSGVLRDGELSAWESRIRRMPDRLRAGPYYLLGRAHLGRRQNDQAAIAFLRLPVVYDTHHRLAARACLEAAETLAESGRTVEARTLYHEITARFADTPFAAVADAALQQPSADNPTAD